MIQCKFKGCGGEFSPRSNRQKYCSNHTDAITQEQYLARIHKDIKLYAKLYRTTHKITQQQIHDLLPDDLICPVVGIKIDLSSTAMDGRLAIRRHDNALPFTADNIYLISAKGARKEDENYYQWA